MAAGAPPTEPLQGRVGAFEGARYLARGCTGPPRLPDVRMFSKTATRFCAVCQQAMVDVLDEVVVQGRA
jgi:hypothetical protein